MTKNTDKQEGNSVEYQLPACRQSTLYNEQVLAQG